MFSNRKYAGVVTPLPWKDHRFFSSSATPVANEEQFTTEFEFVHEGIEFGWVAGVVAGEKIPAIRRGGKIERTEEISISQANFIWNHRLQMWNV